MALVLVQGKNTQDPFSDKRLSNAYAVVNHVELSPKNKTCLIRVHIYTDKISRNLRKPFLNKHKLNREFVVTDDEYDDYFSEPIIKSADKSVFSQSYLWLSQAKEGGTLLWKDWVSDE